MHRTAIALALTLAASTSVQAQALPSVVSIVDGGIGLEFAIGGDSPQGSTQPAGSLTCGEEIPQAAGGRATRGVIPSSFSLTKFCTGTVNHLYEHLLFMRTSAEASELVWTAPDSVSAVNGNTVVFGWQQFQTRFFDAELSVTVTDTSGGAGTAGTATFSFTAIAPPPGNMPQGAALLHAFPYFDFCLDDTCDDMSAELVTPNSEIRISTGLSDTEILISLIGNGAYAVDTWNGILTRLQDGVPDTFANTGLPYGPGDFTGAFETTFTAPQTPASAEGGGMVTINWQISISNATVPVELMQFQVD